MAKKGGGGGGKKGGFWDNPFGGMFDFNGDGKEDWGEQWIAFKIFEECTKEEKPQHDYSSDYVYHSVLDDEDDGTVDTSWRDFCEDGSEFDIDPEDYETEEEYEEALAEAKEKVAWRDTCEDGSDVLIDPEDYETEDEYNEALAEARNAWRYTADDGSDYGLDPDDFETEDEYNDALEEAQANEFAGASAPAISLQFSVECPALDKLEEIKEENYPNKRRYNAAYTLANEFLCYSDKEVERRDKACCQFIIDNADKITAANYLSYEGGFLYAQAIKDNFKLPVSLPDEDEYREYELTETLCKIAKRNTALSFEVWEWALTTFLPYIQYADGSLSELTSSVIDDLYSFPESYRTELARYMDKHPDFVEKVLDVKAEMPSDLDALIAAALQDGLVDAALVLFKRGLAQAGDDWKKINGLTVGTISWCKNYDELESAEYFKLNMLPLVKAIDIGMVQDEIDEWEKGLDEYISQVENDCEQYTYTRKNAWRKSVPDGSKYGLDPRYYDSEQEYLEALNEEKYGWRNWYKDDETLGLDVNDFETQEEYQKAYDARLNEKRQREREQRENERRQLQEQREKERQQRREKEQRIEAEKALVDDKIYTFCGVAFPHALHPYHYRTDDPTIKVGDEVLVPVGDKETIGKVVSVGQYMRVAAPYPVDKTKFIISKIQDEKE
ncbi:MAG: hypothetical protein ACI3XL_06830 [Eubacteriales bacterium]